jgi:hypothetical protein
MGPRLLRATVIRRLDQGTRNLRFASRRRSRLWQGNKGPDDGRKQDGSDAEIHGFDVSGSRNDAG